VLPAEPALYSTPLARIAPSGRWRRGNNLVLTYPPPPPPPHHTLVQGEKVLDMASAPGGKTTHIGQLMGSKGILVANDAKADRLPSLIANLTRMGVTCSIVSCLDGRKVPDAMRGFDRILLDAPCTGLGIIARDPSVRASKTKDDVLRMAHLQKQLALAAIDALDADASSKPGGGGILVYSTCSVTVEENEAVVNYLLRKRHVKLLPVFPPDGEDVGRPVSHSGGREGRVGEGPPPEGAHATRALHAPARHRASLHCLVVQRPLRPSPPRVGGDGCRRPVFRSAGASAALPHQPCSAFEPRRHPPHLHPAMRCAGFDVPLGGHVPPVPVAVAVSACACR